MGHGGFFPVAAPGTTSDVGTVTQARKPFAAGERCSVLTAHPEELIGGAPARERERDDCIQSSLDLTALPGKTLGRAGWVVVADDEDIVRDVLSQMLRADGWDVLLARNGEEAVELVFTDERVDCVILDLTMPLMNGRAAYRRIRELRPTLPVLLSSGYNESSVKGMTADDPHAAFVVKPFRRKNLVATLAKLCSRGDKQVRTA